MQNTIIIYSGHVLDKLKEIPDNSIQCTLTSPPYYGLRNYGAEPRIWGGNSECEHEWQEYSRKGMSGGPSEKQDSNRGSRFESIYNNSYCSKCGAWLGHLGLEPTFEEFIEHLVDIFREVRRVLRDDGVLYLNIGDSYSGSGGPGSQYDSKNPGYGKTFTKFNNPNRKISNLPNKSLCMIPSRLAIAMQDDGWILRSDIIWHKPNTFVESVTDRPTSSYEHIFMFVKSNKYFWDQEAVKEDCITPADSKASQMFGSKHGKLSNGVLAHTNDLGKKWRKDSRSLKRNLRNVWNIPTIPLSCAVCAVCGKYWHRKPPKTHCNMPVVGHFASFPVDLVEKCIRSGASEHGCCPKCLSPYKRIIEKGEPILNAWSMKGMGQYDLNLEDIRETSLEEGSTLKHIIPTKTIGWEPTCNCAGNDKKIPCTILDPFLGSGTTGLVAAKLGLNCIGIELNNAYISMAKGRLSRELGIFAKIEIKK